MHVCFNASMILNHEKGYADEICEGDEVGCSDGCGCGGSSFIVFLLTVFL